MLHSCFGVVGSVRVALHSSLLRFFSVYNFFHTFVCAGRCVVVARRYYAVSSSSANLFKVTSVRRFSPRTTARCIQDQRSVHMRRRRRKLAAGNDNRVDSPLFPSSSSQAQSLYSAGVFISHMPKSKSTACRYRLLARIQIVVKYIFVSQIMSESFFLLSSLSSLLSASIIS